MQELLTRDQVARRFNVTPLTIYNWERRGLIPRIQISRKVVRYASRDVELMEAALYTGGGALNRRVRHG
jgi:DNA-binding transcriptional MerR regulator